MKRVIFNNVSGPLLLCVLFAPAIICLSQICVSQRADAEGLRAIGVTAPSTNDTAAKDLCVSSVNECFIQKGAERSACFYRAAQGPKCHDTDLGRFVMRRWAMSPSRDSTLDSAPAFLGPQLIDQACLTNFDNQWSGLLLKGEINEEDIRKLDAALASCKKEPPSIDLTRP